MRWMTRSMMLAALLIILPSAAAEIEIDESASIVAVVTHKAGLGASQAHDHLAAATGYQASLELDPAAPAEASFELEFPTEKLEIDRWDLQQAWYPRLAELGVLDEPFEELSEKNRGKIREAMRSKRQLDAAAFPRIAARVGGIAERPSTAGDTAFPYTVTLELEVHGQTVRKPVAARYEAADGRLVVEAVGVFLFTDFGIKPYSAAFGLVKNRDDFHVFLHPEGSLPAAEASESPK